MVYEKSCGAVVFTRVDAEIKYLIVQQLEGFHGFPKGHMEDGETEEQTAFREILEEIGVKAHILDGFKTIDEHMIPNRRDTIKQVIYFLAEYDRQQISIQEDELLEAKLMTYDEAMNIFEYESTKRILTEANDFLYR